jgi:NtrC-family two-component system response regulator AlgB
MASIVIVDDEKNIRRNLAVFFESLGHRVRAAAGGAEAIAALGDEPADLVLTDVRMAEMDGLRLLEEIKRRDPATVVVLMTAFATVENAVAAMKAGAQDYVTKPFTLDEIRRTLERALELRGLRVENRELRSAVEQAPMLETESAAMRRLLDTARQAAASDATILLTGESGAGKNVLARQIHQLSPRRDHPFITVNCTTLSEQLLESELFGHMRGSFTGAVKDKPGRLEAAHQGSVFLDEIADLTPALQTKFLRFVQELSFERIGGERTIQVDARIIAATNRDLDSEVAAHRFREDLFYRLNVISLRVPPLRERAGDIVPLARWLLRAAGLRNRRPNLRLGAEAETALRRHRWPGNIRELRNAVERAAVLCRSDEIAPDDLPDSIFREPGDPGAAAAAGAAQRSPSLEDVEREHIRRVLAETATLEEAADALGINVTTLWRKRRRYRIE